MVLNLRNLFGGVLLCFAAASTGCDNSSHASGKSDKKKTAQPAGEALAKIDEVTITVDDFSERINKQTPYVRARYTSLERKKEFLDNLIRFEVLAKEADRRGLSEDAEVVRTTKQVMIQKLLKEEFDKVKLEDVSDAECKKYFDAHPEEFSKPEEVRGSLILVKDAKTAAKVLADSRIKGVDNQGYRNLVNEFSIDAPTKDRGGDLRYFDANTKEVPKHLVDATFKLQNVGDVSPAIETKEGQAIVKLTGRRKALNRSFDEVKQQIRNRLYRDKRQDSMETFVKALREKAKINIDDAKLAKVTIDPAAPGSFNGPGVPPPGPGGFQPGAPGMPQATPMAPSNPPGASGIAVPGPAPAPSPVPAPAPGHAAPVAAPPAG